MNEARARVWSSVGKKLLTGVTGILLMGFVAAHLAGNLLLLAGPDAFNAYAHKLEQMGILLYAAEAGLAAVFLLHALAAINVWIDNRRGRATTNVLTRSKGGQSRMTISSRTMVVTGLVLLGFVVFHVVHFKLGPGVDKGYVAALHGEQVRDLYRLVVEEFHNPLVVALYTTVMVLLGFHLRHGFWSAFQSLGLLNRTLRPLAFAAGFFVALAIAVGFFILPLYIFLFVEGPGSAGLAMVHP